ncbi:MAG: hypothetical protein KKC03_13050, partial [Bacteroidetes bacterium]|nr:hypothetical protein [Bacteroidota bacterium]
MNSNEELTLLAEQYGRIQEELKKKQKEYRKLAEETDSLRRQNRLPSILSILIFIIFSISIIFTVYNCNTNTEPSTFCYINLFNPQDRPDQYILYQNVEWDMDRDIGTFDS